MFHFTRRIMRQNNMCKVQCRSIFSNIESIRNFNCLNGWESFVPLYYIYLTVAPVRFSGPEVDPVSSLADATIILSSLYRSIKELMCLSAQSTATRCQKRYVTYLQFILKKYQSYIVCFKRIVNIIRGKY